MSEASTQTQPTAPAPAARPFGARLLGALRLDGGSYAEVARDPGALGQAVAVVALASAAEGAGFAGYAGVETGVLRAVSVAAIWVVSAATIWAIARWFGHDGSLPATLRTLGFATAPRALLVLVLIPAEMARVAVAFVGTALFIAAYVMGVRATFSVSTGWAALICLVAGLVLTLFWLVVVSFLQAA